ncbi:MAG TPA: FAD-dependent oxidoreductase [Rhodanobacteraceae bacterium]|nr:FAD-dependent oxidoreductase [Rhodanobacteraceae bacterium]
MAFDVPALVLGAGINGLGVARSLARARVPAWLLDADVRRVEMHTRAANALPVRALHGDALIDDLVRLGTSQFRGLRPVLFPTREDTVRTVSRHRHRLAALYRFTLPPRDVLYALTHKHGFQRIAERFGAPIPPLVRVRSVVDLAALESLRYPVVVKPGERHASYVRQFRKAYRIENAADAIDLIRRILPVMPDVVVQEWIEGSDADIHFCLQYRDTHGHATASFTGRKIRSWPPQVGGTASCVAAPEAHAELVALTDRFFRDAGVVGMAGMEYKRDARSGAFQMVEPTIGRTDYQEEVATLNGVNLPHAAYCAELGLADFASTTAKRFVVWRVRSEDFQSAAAQDQRLAQGCPRGARVMDALWRWNDPMPFVVQCLRHARRALLHGAPKTTSVSQVAGSPR